MAKALICENDPEVQKNISLIVKSFNLIPLTTLSLEEAINLLESNDISLAIVNEAFADEKPAENRIIQYINNLPMYRRREIMLVIIGKNFKSSSRFQAFAKGADLVINTNDLDNFLQIFKRGYSEYLLTYKQYKELLNR